MNNTGYFTISRKLKESWLHPINEQRKFTKYEAWIWIIENARYICSNPIYLNGKLITIPRGYFSTTVGNLSNVFNWDKRTTEKFLQLLEDDQKIKRFKINPKDKRSYTLIKVNNYNAYQPQICDLCTSEYKSKCNLNCSDKKKPVAPPKKKEKLTFGSLKNIKLTPEELERLNKEYGENNTNKAIEFLSKYKKEKSYKTKDDNLTLRRWVFNAINAQKVEEQQPSVTEDFYMSLSR